MTLLLNLYDDAIADLNSGVDKWREFLREVEREKGGIVNEV